jgi:hypothetical protein
VRWNEIAGQRCSVARSLPVVGDRWSKPVERDASLVAAGVFEKHRYSDHPGRFECRLTDKGRGLHRVVIALLRRGDRWMQQGDPPVVPRHPVAADAR